MISKNLRDNTLNFLSKKFKSELAIRIEESIFKFSNIYAEDNNTPFLLEQIYESKSDDFNRLLSNKNLEFIIKNIKEKKIDPNKIAFMKPSELDFEKYGEILKKQQQLDKKNEPKGSSAHTCEKCNKSNVSISELQTRSGDEPATVFLTCLECNHVVTL